MAIPERIVAQIVAETSERMKDATYSQLAVGSFVQAQPQVSQYLSVRSGRIGGAQGVLTVAFHAEILRECLARAHGSEPGLVDFHVLDRASQGDPIARLAELEPSLASYIASNVDEDVLRLELSRIALSLTYSL